MNLWLQFFLIRKRLSSIILLQQRKIMYWRTGHWCHLLFCFVSCPLMTWHIQRYSFKWFCLKTCYFQCLVYGVALIPILWCYFKTICFQQKIWSHWASDKLIANTCIVKCMINCPYCFIWYIDDNYYNKLDTTWIIICYVV